MENCLVAASYRFSTICSVTGTKQWRKPCQSDRPVFNWAAIGQTCKKIAVLYWKHILTWAVGKVLFASGKLEFSWLLSPRPTSTFREVEQKAGHAVFGLEPLLCEDQTSIRHRPSRLEVFVWNGKKSLMVKQLHSPPWTGKEEVGGRALRLGARPVQGLAPGSWPTLLCAWPPPAPGQPWKEAVLSFSVCIVLRSTVLACRLRGPHVSDLGERRCPPWAALFLGHLSHHIFSGHQERKALLLQHHVFIIMYAALRGFSSARVGLICKNTGAAHWTLLPWSLGSALTGVPGDPM